MKINTFKMGSSAPRQEVYKSAEAGAPSRDSYPLPSSIGTPPWRVTSIGTLYYEVGYGHYSRDSDLIA
jgi:hypothetical protein